MTETLPTRKDALAAGASRYFSKKPCRRGHRAPRRVVDRSCTACTQDYQKRYRVANRARIASRTVERNFDNPEAYLWRKARGRAKRLGLAFSITIDDVRIPPLCPVLGIPLARCIGGPGPSSPTIDRIVADRGYVAGNVIVVSYRANRIKNDSTPDELRRVADFYTKLQPHSDG